jgi:hypothetical protein
VSKTQTDSPNRSGERGLRVGGNGRPRLLIVNALTTLDMMLILTYQLESVTDYSALKSGLARSLSRSVLAVSSAFVSRK